MAAWLIDLVIVGALLMVLGMAVGVASAVLGGYAQAVYIVATFVLATGYWMALEVMWDGRTIGKRVLGLRVVGERGLRLSVGQVVLRNLLRPVDMLPAFGAVGALVMAVHPEHRRLGDLAAGTLVIRERRVPPPEALAGPAAEQDRRRGARPLEVSPDVLRRVGNRERELLLDLCMRRDALDEDVRLRLFSSVAEHYRRELDLTQQLGISDERLVLELTTALSARGDSLRSGR